MSFTTHYRETVDITPADHLANWRISLTQKRLRVGRTVATIHSGFACISRSALPGCKQFRLPIPAISLQPDQQECKYKHLLFKIDELMLDAT